MNEPTAIVAYEEIGSPLSVQTIKHQVQAIQEVMRDAMVEGTHYGKIPGVDKPTLFQSGAEKLCLTFRLAPTYKIETTDLGNGHREVTVRCTLTHIPSGKVFGEGAGSCSTMESKYRYRNVSDYELTGEPIPKDAKEKKKEYRAKGYGMKKVEGTWEWVKYGDSERQENPDIADTYNTVLKIAQKRAYVGTVKSALAASDIFTVDVEDTHQTNAPREYEEVEVVDSRVAVRPADVVTISDEVKNRVHNDTLYALELGDAKLMAEAWKDFDADQKVVLWGMFNSAQRTAIKKLQQLRVVP